MHEQKFDANSVPPASRSDLCRDAPDVLAPPQVPLSHHVAMGAPCTSDCNFSVQKKRCKATGSVLEEEEEEEDEVEEKEGGGIRTVPYIAHVTRQAKSTVHLF